MEMFIYIASEVPEGSRDLGLLSMPFEKRQKTRQKTALDSGLVVGLMLPRGALMRGGDVLVAESGQTVRVSSSPEWVSRVQSSDPDKLARVAYHLGNRHVWVQIGTGWLAYLRDHVLDHMVQGLGQTPVHELQPFEPEAGAYDNQGNETHGHSHDH